MEGPLSAPAFVVVRSAAEPRYHLDAALPGRVARAVSDLRAGLVGWRLPASLAWLDLRNRYRGSVLGPFWLTLSTGAMLLGLGVLYATLFGLELANYLPHLAVSLIVWNLIAGMVGEACGCMTGQEGVIRQLRIPYSVHALRCVMRNALTAAHNLPLILVVFVSLGHRPGWEALGALPGLGLIALDALAVALFLGMLCARFRDIGPIVASVMQIAFFMTPVLWKPELLTHGARWLPLNPFYAVLETVRGPLVEGGTPAATWLAATAWTALLLTIALAFFARFRGRIAFWV